MQISKDMLIGELLQKSESDCPDFNACRYASPGLPVFSGRVSGRGTHGSRH